MSEIVGRLSTALGHVSTGKGMLQKLGTLGNNTLNRLDSLEEDNFKISSKDSLGSSSYELNSSQKYNVETGQFEESQKSQGGKVRDHIAENTKGKIIGVDGKHGGSVWGTEFGSENNKLNIDALGYEVEGEASLNIGKDGVNLSASGHAEAYLGRVEYEGRNGVLVGKGKAYIGAEANGALDLNFNPFNGDASAEAGVDVFAGGKAEVEGGVDGRYGKAGANGGVSYGVGFEAGADIGFKDGKVGVDLDFGATLGLGFDVGIEAEVDVKESVKTVYNGAKDVTGGAVEGVKDVAGGVKNITGKIPFTPWG